MSRTEAGNRSPDGPSPATARRLRLLRLRLAALLGAVVFAVVTVFTVAVIRMDAQLRSEQNEATLLRQLDEVGRELTFVDGGLEPEDPTPLLDPTVVVGVRPDFDVFDIVDRQDLWDRFPEPEAEQLDILVDEIFFGLGRELQDEMLFFAGLGEELDDEERSAAVTALLADPPEDLIDEAYRVYLVDTANELDIALESPIEVFGDNDIVLAIGEGELGDLLAGLADGDDAGPFTIDVGERRLGVRGTVLRDGPEVRGAIAAFVDLEFSDAAHRRLRNRVLGIAGALVACSALATWWLAGRSIRPAAAALGQQERFLAAAAHELRTPVTAIRTTAEAAIGTDDGTAALARVGELATGASQLTDDLLTLARMDADRLELDTTPARLDLLVEAAIDGDPAFRLVATPAVVEADVSLLTRAVDNLLANARTHGQASPDRPADVTVDPGGVTVTDRGPGIAPREREAVFERFRSGPRSPGHGLGLPLARWVARAHGGDLRIVDPGTDGAGASLRLEVPTRAAS